MSNPLLRRHQRAEVHLFARLDQALKVAADRFIRKAAALRYFLNGHALLQELLSLVVGGTSCRHLAAFISPPDRDVSLLQTVRASMSDNDRQEGIS